MAFHLTIPASVVINHVFRLDITAQLVMKVLGSGNGVAKSTRFASDMRYDPLVTKPVVGVFCVSSACGSRFNRRWSVCPEMFIRQTRARLTRRSRGLR